MLRRRMIQSCAAALAPLGVASNVVAEPTESKPAAVIFSFRNNTTDAEYDRAMTVLRDWKERLLSKGVDLEFALTRGLDATVVSPTMSTEAATQLAADKAARHSALQQGCGTSPARSPVEFE